MPPSGCALIDEEVGGAELGDRERVLRPAHALVGRDRDAHVLRAQADLGELVDRRARLLHVLEVERRERVDGVLGLVDVPAAVRVDADATLGAERLAHGAHAGDIRGQGLVAARDLHLRGTASGEPGEHRAHAVGVDRRHGRVDRDPVAQRGRRRVPAVVDRRGEPGGCLVVVVLDERRELRPALRPLEEHRLAHVDAAEPGHEREGDHPRRGEQLVEGGQGRGVVGHPPIVAPTGTRHPEFGKTAPLEPFGPRCHAAPAMLGGR